MMVTGQRLYDNCVRCDLVLTRLASVTSVTRQRGAEGETGVERFQQMITVQCVQCDAGPGSTGQSSPCSGKNTPFLVCCRAMIRSSVILATCDLSSSLSHY